METKGSPEPSSLAVGGILWDIALNAIIPFLLYRLSKRYISSSEMTALLIATTFPLAKSILDLGRRRQLDPITILVLLGIAASAIALLFGGGPRMLLLRESLFTGVFGLACFGSLFLPRPMMFYFGRHFQAGADPVRRRRYEASWALSHVRYANRLITIVWGAVYLGEFGIRVVFIYLLATAWVLVLSPILLGTLTVITLIWTFRYVRIVRERAIPELNQLLARNSG